MKQSRIYLFEVWGAETLLGKFFAYKISVLFSFTTTALRTTVTIYIIKSSSSSSSPLSSLVGNPIFIPTKIKVNIFLYTARLTPFHNYLHHLHHHYHQHRRDPHHRLSSIIVISYNHFFVRFLLTVILAPCSLTSISLTRNQPVISNSIASIRNFIDSPLTNQETKINKFLVSKRFSHSLKINQRIRFSCEFKLSSDVQFRTLKFSIDFFLYWEIDHFYPFCGKSKGYYNSRKETSLQRGDSSFFFRLSSWIFPFFFAEYDQSEMSKKCFLPAQLIAVIELYGSLE